MISIMYLLARRAMCINLIAVDRLDELIGSMFGAMNFLRK
jgi:hypothetical protein